MRPQTFVSLSNSMTLYILKNLCTFFVVFLLLNLVTKFCLPWIDYRISFKKNHNFYITLIPLCFLQFLRKTDEWVKTCLYLDFVKGLEILQQQLGLQKNESLRYYSMINICAYVNKNKKDRKKLVFMRKNNAPATSNILQLWTHCNLIAEYTTVYFPECA